MASVTNRFNVNHAISISGADFGYKTAMMAYEHLPHNNRMQSD
jgi:hypothetical protein